MTTIPPYGTYAAIATLSEAAVVDAYKVLVQDKPDLPDDDDTHYAINRIKAAARGLHTAWSTAARRMNHARVVVTLHGLGHVVTQFDVRYET